MNIEIKRFPEKIAQDFSSEDEGLRAESEVKAG